MTFKQQRIELFRQVILALAGLGAIAPGCIAFATGLPEASPTAVTVQAQPVAVQTLKAPHK